MGITFEGDSAVSKFCTTTGGHRLVKTSTAGDVVVDGNIYCEIKEAKGNTANQVRPCSCNVLVVHAPGIYPGKKWLVLSPLEQILDSRSRSGQHTQLAFFCYNIGVKTKRYAKNFVSDADLLSTIREKARDQTVYLREFCEGMKTSIIEQYKRIDSEYMARLDRAIRLIEELNASQ